MAFEYSAVFSHEHTRQYADSAYCKTYAIITYKQPRREALSAAGALHDQEYRQFLERLKQARLDAGMTQKEVAKELGKDQSFVSRSETGERRVDVIELAAFARLYGEPLDYFIDE